MKIKLMPYAEQATTVFSAFVDLTERLIDQAFDRGDWIDVHTLCNRYIARGDRVLGIIIAMALGQISKYYMPGQGHFRPATYGQRLIFVTRYVDYSDDPAFSYPVGVDVLGGEYQPASVSVSSSETAKLSEYSRGHTNPLDKLMAMYFSESLAQEYAKHSLPVSVLVKCALQQLFYEIQEGQLKNDPEEGHHLLAPPATICITQDVTHANRHQLAKLYGEIGDAELLWIPVFDERLNIMEQLDRILFEE